MAVLLIIAVLFSMTGALAATYTKTTRFAMTTCGDKFPWKTTTLYIKNYSSSSAAIVATVIKNDGCGVSRKVCVIFPGSTGVMRFYTGFRKVGNINVELSKSLGNRYSCSLYNTDNTPVIKVG